MGVAMRFIGKLVSSFLSRNRDARDKIVFYWILYEILITVQAICDTYRFRLLFDSEINSQRHSIVSIKRIDTF